MQTPPMDFLVNEFTYFEYAGHDEWQHPIYNEPIQVKQCRIDDGEVYSVAGNQRSLLYNAVIFCYAGATEPFIDFKVNSKVIISGSERIITRVIPVFYIYQDNIYAYELEVI